MSHEMLLLEDIIIKIEGGEEAVEEGRGRRLRLLVPEINSVHVALALCIVRGTFLYLVHLLHALRSYRIGCSLISMPWTGSHSPWRALWQASICLRIFSASVSLFCGQEGTHHPGPQFPRWWVQLQIDIG